MLLTNILIAERRRKLSSFLDLLSATFGNVAGGWRV